MQTKLILKMRLNGAILIKNKTAIHNIEYKSLNSSVLAYVLHWFGMKLALLVHQLNISPYFGAKMIR